MPQDPQNDPDFMKASTADQLAYLRANDKDFAAASPQDQFGYLLHVTSQHIGVNTGGQTSSPGYQYSTGYQGPNDAPRDSGGFIDRLTTQAGRALQNPSNFLPSVTSLLGPLDPMPTINAYRQLQAAREGAPQEDLAKTLGNQVPAAIAALVTHAADSLPNPVKAAAESPARGPALHSEKVPAQPLLDTSVQRTIPAGTPAKSVGPAYGPNTPPMEAAQSSTVDLHGYNPSNRTMTVQFKNGNVYQLKGVPQEIWNNYKNAESQGSFYQQNLKGRYETELIGRVGKGTKIPKASPAPSRPPTPAEQSGNEMLMQWMQQAKASGKLRNPPSAMSEGMDPISQSLWQQGAFGEQPQADTMAQTRAAQAKTRPALPRD